MKKKPRLLSPPPKNRTYDQLLNHYHVECAIADTLRNATRDERRIIVKTMYDRLFAQVPDHPRLTRRVDPTATALKNVSKRKLVEPFLHKQTRFLEIAPGDCEFAYAIAESVTQVASIDISDQREKKNGAPHNFSLWLYDGYKFTHKHDGDFDVAFSDQLIEHIHPKDVLEHFILVRRLLKKGGRYLSRSPHAQSGPHDISRYFSRVAKGFHLKEWTYCELVPLIKRAGYQKVRCHYYYGDRFHFSLPFLYFRLMEYMLTILPFESRRKFARYVVPCVIVEAMK